MPPVNSKGTSQMPTKANETCSGWAQIMLSAAERIGIPTVLLVICLTGFYYLAKPIAEEHVKLLQNARDAMQSQTTMLITLDGMIKADIADAKERTNLLKEQQILLKELVAAQQQTNDSIKKLHQND